MINDKKIQRILARFIDFFGILWYTDHVMKKTEEKRVRPWKRTAGQGGRKTFVLPSRDGGLFS